MAVPTKQRHSRQAEVLQVDSLSLVTPAGRVLIDDLKMSLSTEKVAIVGRNGVGKSTLLHVLAGLRSPSSGTVHCSASRAFVAQELNLDPQLSRGQCRKRSLLAAKESGAELLLLDEPTQDLDAGAKSWLASWLSSWPGALLVATHDEELLSTFEHFFVIAESGCRYFPGSYEELQEWQEDQGHRSEQKYIRGLNALARQEERSAIVARRRRRKKMGGRVRELDRATPRSVLNRKRSMAQEYQGKREKLQAAKISAARSWARATRRALTVKLDLTPLLPTLPRHDNALNLDLQKVSLRRAGTLLFADLDLQVGRERIALRGSNGSGKTSLLELMSGIREPNAGRVLRRARRMASIRQGASGWHVEDSLLSHLLSTSQRLSADDVAQRIVGHKFPLALAARPISSLSPGERVRAALLCIFEQEPAVELILLDEPTYCLDRAGQQALRQLLSKYRGGLVVASHDPAFLRSIGITHELALPPDEGAKARLAPLRD